LKIGQQLEEIAEQVGGTINSNPLTVLNILSIHNKKVADLLDMVPDDANPNHRYSNNISRMVKGY
jgi:hypothetical protein